MNMKEIRKQVKQVNSQDEAFELGHMITSGTKRYTLEKVNILLNLFLSTYNYNPCRDGVGYSKYEYSTVDNYSLDCRFSGKYFINNKSNMTTIRGFNTLDDVVEYIITEHMINMEGEQLNSQNEDFF